MSEGFAQDHLTSRSMAMWKIAAVEINAVGVAATGRTHLKHAYHEGQNGCTASIGVLVLLGK